MSVRACPPKIIKPNKSNHFGILWEKKKKKNFIDHDQAKSVFNVGGVSFFQLFKHRTMKLWKGKAFFFFSFNIILKNRKVGVRDKVRGKVVVVIAGRGTIGNYMKPAEVEWCLSHAFCRTSWLQQSMPIMVFEARVVLVWLEKPSTVCVLLMCIGGKESLKRIGMYACICNCSDHC